MEQQIEELEVLVDQLNDIIQKQEHQFKHVFLAGFNSKEKDPNKGWLKYAKEESDYEFDYL